MSAILKFDFQKREQLRTLEVNDQNFQLLKVYEKVDVHENL